MADRSRGSRKEILSPAERREQAAAAAAAPAPPDGDPPGVVPAGAPGLEAAPASSRAAAVRSKGSPPLLDKPRHTTIVLRPSVRKMIEYGQIEYRVNMSEFIEMAVLAFLRSEGVREPRDLRDGASSP
jgi:hypothetical protein